MNLTHSHPHHDPQRLNESLKEIPLLCNSHNTASEHSFEPTASEPTVSSAVTQSVVSPLALDLSQNAALQQGLLRVASILAAGAARAALTQTAERTQSQH